MPNRIYNLNPNSLTLNDLLPLGKHSIYLFIFKYFFMQSNHKVNNHFTRHASKIYLHSLLRLDPGRFNYLCDSQWLTLQRVNGMIRI